MTDLLQQIPITLQIAFVTAILTATATLSGVYLTNKENTKRLVLQLENEREIKQNELMREKLEELYLLSKKWAANIDIAYLNHTRAMNGDFDFETLLNIEKERNDKNACDFSRLEMLIDLYFPNIKVVYEEVIKARTKANQFMLVYRNNCLEGNTDGKKFVEQFLHAQEKFSEEVKKMIKVIAEQANKFRAII